MSAPDLAGCPPGQYPEYAFVGRSNVGKSSLINMLTGHKDLARTSSDPGKTRLINFFLVDKEWYLVDLPGFGYARIAKTKRKAWDFMIREYLESRKSLFYIFLLIDSRHDPQTLDLNFIQWMGDKALPFCLVFTKTDKLTKVRLRMVIEKFRESLNNKWEELPPIFTSSSKTGSGKTEILDFISRTNSEYGYLLTEAQDPVT